MISLATKPYQSGVLWRPQLPTNEHFRFFNQRNNTHSVDFQLFATWHIHCKVIYGD